MVLAASLMGVTGCSTMNMDVRMVPNLQTQVTGAEAQSGFRSFTYLNQISTRDGGGLYDGKAKEDNRLTPMQALNRIMDGHEVNYVNKANDKPHPVRSWAELRGLESFVRQMQGEGGTTAVPQHQ